VAKGGGGGGEVEDRGCRPPALGGGLRSSPPQILLILGGDHRVRRNGFKGQRVLGYNRPFLLFSKRQRRVSRLRVVGWATEDSPLEGRIETIEYVSDASVVDRTS